MGANARRMGFLAGGAYGKQAASRIAREDEVLPRFACEQLMAMAGETFHVFILGCVEIRCFAKRGRRHAM